MLKKLQSLLSSNYFIQASLFYILGTFFLQGISFLTTPIFTRVLLPSDFGVTSVFSTWVTFFAVFIAAQVSGSIAPSRIHMTEERFHSYLKNIIYLGILCAAALSVLCLVFRIQLSRWLQIEPAMMLHLLIQAYGSALSTFYTTYLIQTKKPKQQIVFSILVAVITTVMGLALVLSIQNGKYWGKILAGTAVNAVIILYVLIYFLPFKSSNTIFKDWKYCLRLSMPLIVHLLANIIIGQSSRVILTELLGEAETGRYYVAYNIGIIGMLFVEACSKAWTPWYLDNTQKRDTLLVNRFSKLFVGVSACAFAGVALFTPEILKIMAPESYWGTSSTTLLIIFSVFFQFLYRFPLGYEQYCQNMKWVAACTLVTAFVNVRLNYIFIPMFGMMGAGLASVFSYLLLFLLHEIVARVIIKDYNISFSSYLPGIAGCAGMVLAAYMLLEMNFFRYILLAITIMVFFKLVFSFANRNQQSR